MELRKWAKPVGQDFHSTLLRTIEQVAPHVGYEDVKELANFEPVEGQ